MQYERVRGPIVAKLCADVTVTWIRTEKLLGGVISHKACTSRATSGFWLWERGAASSKGFRSHIMINTMGDLETSRPFSMLEILADQAIMRGVPDEKSRRNSRPCGTLPILERTRESWWQESQRRQAEASWLAAKLRASVPCGYAP